MSKFYKHDVREFVSLINTEEQALEAMTYLYNILRNDDLEGYNCVQIMCAIGLKFPIVKTRYKYNQNEWCYKDRFERIHTSYISSTQPIITNTDTIPQINYNDHFPGLYFLGQIGYNPILDKKIYFVKVGQSEDIGKRVKQYFSYNPLIYYNHTCLPIDNNIERKCCESICHNYLSKYTISYGQNAYEWFQVSEENYYELCKQFSDVNTFNLIAHGGI
jgi:hypothetical protein